jgi:putative addiction module component (TIGR02574 family)
MAMSLSRIREEIQELSDSDKEALLRELLEELDGPADADVDAAWLAEAQRRSAEIDAGIVQCIPAEEVFVNLEKMLKK